MSHRQEEIEDFAHSIHGEIEMSRGGPMSEEQVVRLVTKLSKIKLINSQDQWAASQVPDYVKNSDVWEKIRNFFPDTVGRME